MKLPAPTEIWLTPLVLLPGVALLIQSTSQRLAQIHDEFHHLIDHIDARARIDSRKLVERSSYYRRALVSLYTAVVLFSVGSFLGGLLHMITTAAIWVVGGLTLVGIGFLTYAALQMVREAFLADSQIEALSQRLEEEPKVGGSS